MSDPHWLNRGTVRIVVARDIAERYQEWTPVSDLARFFRFELRPNGTAELIFHSGDSPPEPERVEQEAKA